MVNTQTILVVDDEVLIRLHISDLLRDTGYQVVEAASGDEAVTVMLSHLDLDLVITDVRMPGEIDGLQLTTYFKRLHPSRPVIVASAHLELEDAGTADAFLPKPFSDASILESVERLIGSPWNEITEDRSAS